MFSEVATNYLPIKQEVLFKKHSFLLGLRLTLCYWDGGRRAIPCQAVPEVMQETINDIIPGNVRERILIAS